MVVVQHVECLIFFFNQNAAYEMRSSDWSSDVCSSDLSVFRQAHRVDRCAHPVLNTGSAAVLRRSGVGEASSRWVTPSKRQRCPNSVGISVLVRGEQIGRASCRERVCQFVYISVVAVSLKNKIITVCILAI